jgi:hypothetical protein
MHCGAAAAPQSLEPRSIPKEPSVLAQESGWSRLDKDSHRI